MKKTKFVKTNLSGAQFQGANLENAKFEGAILEGTQFQGANMAKAKMMRAKIIDTNLKGANLTGANLKGAILTGANFESANLTGANLSDTKLFYKRIIPKPLSFEGANLTDAKFTNARLEKTKFAGANLRSANLTDTFLDNSDFAGADLTSANLKNAGLLSANLAYTYLIGADLTRSFLTYANLRGANLTSANLTGAHGTEMIFTNAVLRDANLTDADLTRVNLRGANLTNSFLTRANLRGADLTGAGLARADLTGTILAGANLTGAVLIDANLRGTILADAILAGADLRYAMLLNANLMLGIIIDANLTRANLTGAILTGAILTGANLTGVNLTRANLTHAILAGANLTDANLTNVIGMHQRAEMPQQAEPQRMPGQPFEIHNQFNFDFDFVKFMEIIRRYNTEQGADVRTLSPASPNSRSDEAEPELGEDLLGRQITQQLLKPLIDYPGYTQKRNVLKQLNIAYEGRDEDAIQDTITFVLLQSPNFIKKYISNFTNDCITAYNRGRRTSCVKGQYERIFLNIQLVINLLCLNDKTDGLKQDCKEVYKDLYACFVPENISAIMNEWWNSQTDMDDYPIDRTEPEKMVFINKKSAEFKDFFIRKYSEKFEGVIDIYIAKTFTIAYFDSELKKPEPVVQLEPQVNIKYDGQTYNFKIVPDRTTIGELKGMLLDKLVETGKNSHVNYTVRFMFSGKLYPNEKNGEVVSAVINQNYEAVLIATMKSNTGMGKTKKRKYTNKITRNKTK